MREYLGVIFRRKSVIITTFITVMITVVLGLELKTPSYESSMMLVSARKERNPYYKDLWRVSVNTNITYPERDGTHAVLERVVRVLNRRMLSCK